MNKVILVGNLARDPEMRQTPNGVSVARFSVAVSRRFSKDGQQQTDFIECVAWRQQAEFIGKYFRKGRMIAIEGNLRTRTYDDKNGTKHYVTEVYVDNVSFTGEKSENGYNNSYQNGYAQQASAPQNNYNNAPSNDELSIGDMADFEVLSDDGVPF